MDPLHMDEQRQDDPLEPSYNSSVPIQDVALKTYGKRWMIEKGGGRGSGISMLMVRHDDEYLDWISSSSPFCCWGEWYRVECVLNIFIQYQYSVLTDTYKRTPYNKLQTTNKRPYKK